MAVTPSEEIAFDEDDLTPVVDVFSRLSEASAGWVNLLPEVEPEDAPPPRNLLVAVFSARGAAVPLATWTAAPQPGQRSTIGIEHGSGPKAIQRLAEHDLALRPGWLKVADHPRRGLVVTVPPDEDPDELVWWLLAASHALSTVPLSGSWLARVYGS